MKVFLSFEWYVDRGGGYLPYRGLLVVQDKTMSQGWVKW